MAIMFEPSLLHSSTSVTVTSFISIDLSRFSDEVVTLFGAS